MSGIRGIFRTIVGDFNREKPFMIVEYTKGNNHYMGHRVIKSFKTIKLAKKEARKEGVIR